MATAALCGDAGCLIEHIQALERNTGVQPHLALNNARSACAGGDS
jgi:hypothetical protein